MKSEVVVGDIVVFVKGYKHRIGRRYEVLSITLTNIYLQDIITHRCTDHSIRWIRNDIVKLCREEVIK